jgi:hypothetical protein
VLGFSSDSAFLLSSDSAPFDVVDVGNRGFAYEAGWVHLAANSDCPT